MRRTDRHGSIVWLGASRIPNHPVERAVEGGESLACDARLDLGSWEYLSIELVILSFSRGLGELNGSCGDYRT